MMGVHWARLAPGHSAGRLAARRPHRDAHVLIQAVQDAHQAVNREPAELGAPNAGNIRLGSPGQLAHRDGSQFLLTYCPDELGRQLCLDVLGGNPTSAKALPEPLTTSSFLLIALSPLSTSPLSTSIDPG
jgi:hypothetical protein